MGNFLRKRLLWFLFTLWLVITISFFLMRAVRGGPFDEDRVLHPAAQASIEARYHLDWPLWKQYLQYIGPLNLDQHGLFGARTDLFAGVLALDLGPSLRMRDYTVNDIIRQALPYSVLLGSIALIFALLGGICVGLVAAVKRNSAWDQILMAGTTFGLALPNFVMASFLIIVFAIYVPLFPPAGWGSWKHFVLPSVALALPFSAYIARLTRAGMLEIWHQDYILTARAKGLSLSQIIMKHCLRGALLPVLSYLGPATAGILTGSLVIEKIFAIPGLGTHFVQSALNRDYTLCMGITILYTALVFALNTLVDLSYTLLDKRIRLPA